MPLITPQDRPAPIADESAWRAPKKTIHASTGMDLKQTLSGAPADPNRQVETAEETPPTEVKEATLSPQLTALARKESKLRAQEQAFKAREQAAVTKEAEFGKLTELKAKIAAKDYSILDEIGVSYEEWTNYLINKGAEISPESRKVAELEKKLSTFEEQQKANVNKQYEATVNQYRRDVTNLVASNPEFDSIKAQKAEEHVVQHIIDTFNEDGEILTVEQACKEVEETIIEEAEQYLKLSKVKAKFQPIESAQPKTLPPPKNSPRTLTNQATAGTESKPKNQFQHLSPKERIAQAIARSQK